MRRRDFLRNCSAAAVIGLFDHRRLWAGEATAGGVFKSLRGGIGTFYTGKGGSSAWMVNDTGIAVVDSQYPDWAPRLLAGIPGRGTRRVDLLINTHHHSDHTGGNSVFKPVANAIVAQSRVPELQRGAAVRSDKLDIQTYASTTFQTSWKGEIGGEPVTVRHFGPGHTGGDGIVHFERANVVHLGDVAYNRAYPGTDRPGGCDIRNWIRVVERVVATYPADAIYVFGHARPGSDITGGHKEMLRFRDYLSALLEHVGRGIAAGRSKEEIVALDNFPGFDDFHVPLPNRMERNLAAAYEELTGS